MNWQDELKPLQGKTMMLIGFGNTMRMDDGIGVVVTEQLKEELTMVIAQKKVQVYTADMSPEDCLPICISERPDTVIIIDACNCGIKTGEITLLSGETIPESSYSTHTLSPKVIGSIIEKLAGSKVFYLGIQVRETGFGEEISPPVLAAGKAIVEFFTRFCY